MLCVYFISSKLLILVSKKVIQNIYIIIYHTLFNPLYLRRYQDVSFVVYTGDQGVTAEEILDGARRRFNIRLPRAVKFVFLKHRLLVEAKLYPHFTLRGRAWAPSSWVGGLDWVCSRPLHWLNGLCLHPTCVPLSGGCHVGSYVHYPTISTDMLSVVRERNPG